ncbi:ankyrin repeat-containing domain protein [Trichoderma aethiopicum]
MALSIHLDHLSGLPAELKYDIIGRIPLKSLGRLAQVSRLFHEIVIPILYKEDARDEQPQAIFWAADATFADEGTITKILDLANRYGGDVNRMYSLDEWPLHGLTPLHTAAITGHVAATRKLLELGANVNALGELPDEIHVADLAKRHAIDIGLWRPLLVPLFFRDEKMIQVLLQFGASPVLSVPVDNPTATAYDPGTVNILHILSLEPEAKDTDDASRSYFESLRDLIDVPIREGSTTPLFLALRNQNGRALKNLIVNGANIETLNEFGRTLLTQAIRFRFTSRDAQARQWYNGVAEQLVKSRKSKISNYGPQEAWETPLTCTIKALEDVPTEYKRALQDAGEMLGLLQKHGANLNERSNEGITVLHALCDAICRESNNSKLLDIFRQCVGNGADLSIPFTSGRSVLGTCILKHNERPPRFFKLLMELHAPLAPQEIDAVFIKWALSSSLRKSFDDYVQRYQSQVSQIALDSMYASVLGIDVAAFKQLNSHFPRPTIAERFASEALRGCWRQMKWFRLTLGIQGFDGGYIDLNGNSLLHYIVYRLVKKPAYKDSQARGDARELLLRGANPCQTNARGQTPLQALRSFQQQRDCPTLRFFLYDASALWDDLKAGLATENQWLSLIEGG